MFGYRYGDSNVASKKVERLMSGNETSSDLHSILQSLPEEERIILNLFYLKSKSAAEIAELLGVPVRAVDSVLVMGRQRLLASLGLSGDVARDVAGDVARDEGK